MADKDTGAGTGTGFAIGLSLGAIIGLAFGVLYAPRPGKETRELLRGKATEVVDKAKETAAEVKKRAKAKLAEV